MSIADPKKVSLGCLIDNQLFSVVPFISGVIMVERSIKILVILKHYFKMGSKVAEFRKWKAILLYCSNWFKCSALSFEIRSTIKQLSIIGYDFFKNVEANPTTDTRKLSEERRSLKNAISRLKMYVCVKMVAIVKKDKKYFIYDYIY